ncbi:MAG TPA: hypothetical protein VLG69_00025 [Candidatus Andersenbacteria bacterium]|nr:hypothetical protein [Candidatus Andersenbacteria bacterium]
MKTALRYYKNELRKHLAWCTETKSFLDDIGVQVMFLPQEKIDVLYSRQLRLEGMRQVLGITGDDYKRICAELGFPHDQANAAYTVKLKQN